MTTGQITALANLIQSVRPSMQVIANSLWTNRDASALSSMDGVLADADNAYNSALTAAASKMVSSIRSQYADGAASSTDPGYVALKNLGWSGLGAYYLELSRLNSEVLSMGAIVPSVTMPSWEGLGPYLTKDLAPLIDAIEKYQNAQEAGMAANDTSTAPNGAPGVFASEEIPSSSESTLDKVFQALGITNAVMTGIVNLMLSPTSGDGWTDPLAALISLGHMLIHIALAIIGGGALLSTKIGGFLTTIASVVSLDLPGAVASVGASALSGVIKGLLIPIFGGAMLVLGPGIMLAYILPMTPYIYWMAGVAGWFLLVVEAMIAVPLWGLAHIAFQGEGLHGRGIRGYEVLFSIVFRPAIMIAGLLVSYSIFATLSWLIMKSFTIATAFVFQQGWVTDNWIGLMVLLCVFATTEMGLAMMCFRLISTLPHHIPAMAGMSSVSRVDSDKFADDTTGRGIERATGKVDELVRETIDPGAKERKQKENSRALANDGTIQAYLRHIGRQED
jgi:conjugal transfer/type IV secretion protein DotA/TraY